MKKTNKLTGKDLINVGIYSAIYYVIVFAVAMLGFIPIFMPLLAVFVPILSGIPFMLFLTKVKKPGMVLIMSMITGIMMLLTGMSYYALLVGFFSGIVSELILYKTKYQSSKAFVLTSGTFSIWVWGNFIPIFTNIEKYFSTRQSFGQEYVDTLIAIMPNWMCPVLFVAAFVSGVIGGLLGKKVLKKHFKKAGIA